MDVEAVSVDEGEVSARVSKENGTGRSKNRREMAETRGRILRRELD